MKKGNQIKYKYDIEGRKLQQTDIFILENIDCPIGEVADLTGGQILKEIDTEYLGNVIYKDYFDYSPMFNKRSGVFIHRINFAEGHIKKDEYGNYDIKYHLTDHLGNIRAEMGLDFSHTLNNYFPFGMECASTDMEFAYNGKEKIRIHGFNMYDYGARFYDQTIGRWHSMDPLAEKYYSISPYAYCADNPVKYIDPDGKDAVMVVFPDYKISTPVGMIGGLGHTGVLLIDNKSGLTKYYEYGRYDKGEKGEVRNIRVSDVIIDKDGKPTEASLNKVMGELSKKAGKGSRIDGAYIESDNFKEMNDYAKLKKAENSDSNRKSYGLFTNNCGTFSADVVNQDENVKKDAPTIISPIPKSIVKEYQSTNKIITYDPKKEKINLE